MPRDGVGPSPSGFSDQRSDRVSYLGLITSLGFEPKFAAWEAAVLDQLDDEARTGFLYLFILYSSLLSETHKPCFDELPMKKNTLDVPPEGNDSAKIRTWVPALKGQRLNHLTTEPAICVCFIFTSNQNTNGNSVLLMRLSPRFSLFFSLSYVYIISKIFEKIKYFWETRRSDSNWRLQLITLLLYQLSYQRANIGLSLSK